MSMTSELLPATPPWTEENLRMIALQVQNERRLVRGGAYYTELGRLMLTDEQLELAYQTGDPLAAHPAGPYDGLSELNVAERDDLSLRLDERLSTLVSARISRPLVRSQIYTVRDVYVSGRSKIIEIRTVGKHAVSEIESALDSHGMGLPWLDLPTMRDIVQLAGDVSLVTTFVLEARPDLAGFAGYSLWRLGPHTVQDVLDTPDLKGTRNYYAATAFSEKFAAVKRRLESEVR